MPHIYKVIDESTDRSLGYWQADSKGEAKRAAIKHITAKRLDGSEIVQAHKSGYGISDAKTGQCLNAPEPLGAEIVAETGGETQLDAFSDAQAPQG